jgi:hypothetical protein
MVATAGTAFVGRSLNTGLQVSCARCRPLARRPRLSRATCPRLTLGTGISLPAQRNGDDHFRFCEQELAVTVPVGTTPHEPGLVRLGWVKVVGRRKTLDPEPDPSNPPNPVGLTWIIDGDDAGDNFLNNCALRAYDILSGAVAYDSTATNDISEEIPHFTPITSGGNSVFCTTSKGFMGFTQFPVVAKSLTFIVDRSTFGWNEVDALQPTPTSVASFGSAYWIAVRGVLPGDLGLNAGNLASPPNMYVPTVTASLDSSLPGNVKTAIQNMLNARNVHRPGGSGKSCPARRAARVPLPVHDLLHRRPGLSTDVGPSSSHQLYTGDVASHRPNGNRDALERQRPNRAGYGSGPILHPPQP